MPLIQVKALEGVFTQPQKQEIIERLTDTMVEIEGENMRQVTVTISEEVKSGDWAIGGQTLTTDDAKALARGELNLERGVDGRPASPQAESDELAA